MLAQFVYGLVEIPDDEPVFGGAITTQDEENTISPGDLCVHCRGEVHIPDERTGLIHTSGLYGCMETKNGKTKWTGTVAA